MNRTYRSYYFMTLVIALAFTVVKVAAETAFVNDNGFVTIEGRVTETSYDEFEMSYDGEDIVVVMNAINDDTIQTMINSGIIENGALITVTGRIEEKYGDMHINATSINVYTP